MRGTRLDFVRSKRCNPSSTLWATPVAKSCGSFRRIMEINSHEDTYIMYVSWFFKKKKTRRVHLFVGRFPNRRTTGAARQWSSIAVVRLTFDALWRS